ncbi:ATP-binding protein [Tractidigestivibacter scatoligenes]|uniref:ATP-binding protein n=1 Tax=Tractidigestivibacter scatoligenes TaxID=1299998 RepID=UPI001F430F7A|nr:ATP-binding protein [Tractidigestivibacter scatoligenes]
MVSITGPRQSGKSTLVQATFPEYRYENLEDPGVREMALEDPVGFIRQRPHKLIIDEAQLAPELFNVIQVVSDEVGTPGQYILSGSQNFLLLRQITQSLAGRVGLLRLMPLSYREAHRAIPELSVDDFVIRGGYPRLYDVDIPPEVYYENYLSTYIARDASGYVDPGNLSAFRNFITVCADRCANLLNLTSLANDVGISPKTARSWLSLLESSYVVQLLQPYHANIRKRLTKTPKLYFNDTGLLCHLLGITTKDQFMVSRHRGAIVEDLIISETAKRHINSGKQPQLFFYRDDSKIEVDLLDMTNPLEPELVEVKSSATYRSSFTRHLARVGDLVGADVANQAVVMNVDKTATVGGRTVWSMEDWLLRE